MDSISVENNEQFDAKRLEELQRERRESQHRYIISDEIDRQVQREGNVHYFFRKDFLYEKGAKEYSLVLMYSKEIPS
jgi:hypothetical protein